MMTPMILNITLIAPLTLLMTLMILNMTLMTQMTLMMTTYDSDDSKYDSDDFNDSLE